MHKEIICWYRIPEVLISDNRISFVNALISNLNKQAQISYRLTSAYRPQTNGLVERFNWTIEESLAKIAENKKNWDQYVDSILLAYQTTKHSITELTPFQLVYERQAKLPIELTIQTYPSDEENFQQALMWRAFEITEKLPLQWELAKKRIKVK